MVETEMRDTEKKESSDPTGSLVDDGEDPRNTFLDDEFLDDLEGEMSAGFEYTSCSLRDPIAARAHSERELYSLLLAFAESGAKEAKPFAETEDDIDSGARYAAERMMELHEDERDRIREIMEEGGMDFDSRGAVFASEVTEEMSPQRSEGAAGRNILPFAARHHAIVIALALDALEYSDNEETRELAHDLIIERVHGLAEVKEAQQDK